MKNKYILLFFIVFILKIKSKETMVTSEEQLISKDPIPEESKNISEDTITTIPVIENDSNLKSEQEVEMATIIPLKNEKPVDEINNTSESTIDPMMKTFFVVNINPKHKFFIIVNLISQFILNFLIIGVTNYLNYINKKKFLDQDGPLTNDQKDFFKKWHKFALVVIIISSLWIFLFNFKEYLYLNTEYIYQIKWFLILLNWNIICLIWRCIANMESNHYNIKIDISFIVIQTILSIALLIWNWKKETAKIMDINGIAIIFIALFPILSVAMANTKMFSDV